MPKMQTQAKVHFSIGFILMMFAGLIFAWSIFVEPIEADLGLSRSESSLVFSISLSVSIAGQILAGYLCYKKWNRLCFLLSATLFGLGFFLASMMQSLWELYLSYGVLIGLAIGMVYNAVIIVIVPLFPRKLALVNAALLSAFGLGSLALGGLCSYLISAFGWRLGFKILGLLFAGLCVVGSFFLVDQHSFRSSSVDESQDGLPPIEMLKDKRFPLFYAWNFFLASATFVVFAHAALCAGELGASAGEAVFAVGALSLASALSRLPFAWFYQRFGKEKSLMLVTFVLVWGAGLSYWAHQHASLWLLFFALFLVGLVSGGNSVIAYTYIIDLYGQRYLGMNTGLLNTHIILASLFGSGVAGYLQSQAGHYGPALLFLLGLSTLALVIALGLYLQLKKEA